MAVCDNLDGMGTPEHRPHHGHSHPQSCADVRLQAVLSCPQESEQTFCQDPALCPGVLVHIRDVPSTWQQFHPAPQLQSAPGDSAACS